MLECVSPPQSKIVRTKARSERPRHRRSIFRRVSAPRCHSALGHCPRLRPPSPRLSATRWKSPSPSSVLAPLSLTSQPTFSGCLYRQSLGANRRATVGGWLASIGCASWIPSGSQDGDGRQLIRHVSPSARAPSAIVASIAASPLRSSTMRGRDLAAAMTTRTTSFVLVSGATPSKGREVSSLIDVPNAPHHETPGMLRRVPGGPSTIAVAGPSGPGSGTCRICLCSSP